MLEDEAACQFSLTTPSFLSPSFQLLLYIPLKPPLRSLLLTLH